MGAEELQGLQGGDRKPETERNELKAGGHGTLLGLSFKSHLKAKNPVSGLKAGRSRWFSVAWEGSVLF